MRRVLAAAALTLLGATGGAPAPLAGYDLSATATPVRVTLNDPALPGVSQPTGELIASYAVATAATGPTARALASSLWPGDPVGEGLPALLAGAPRYPVRAEARHPEGPGEQVAETEFAGGMRATASAAAAHGQAAAGGIDLPGVVSAESARGTVTASASGAAEARAVAAGVRVLDGLVTVAEVSTAARASSDGTTATITQDSAVSGLVVAGVAVPPGTTGPVTPPELSAAGVSIEVAARSERGGGGAAEGVSGGVVVTIDARPLREHAGTTPLADAVRGVSDELAAQLQPAFDLAPVVTITLGGAAVAAAGSGALPPPPPPDARADARAAAPAAAHAPDRAVATPALLPPTVPLSAAPPLPATRAVPTRALPPAALSLPLATGVPAWLGGLAGLAALAVARGLVGFAGLGSPSPSPCLEEVQ